MQSTHQAKLLEPLSSPNNSVDWRFLLPILPESKILIVGQSCDDFTRLFNKLGIEAIPWDYDFSNSIKAPLFPVTQFDIVAVPHGFPGKDLSSNPQHHLEIYQTMQFLLKPGGIILVGFSNNLGIRRKFTPGTYSSTVAQTTRLFQKAGFKEVKFYGAIPNLSMPDYIFPITRQTIGFILEHRYRTKLSARLLRWLYNPIFTAGFSHFFTSYFAVAVAPTASSENRFQVNAH
jgi:hypothetical protein